MKKIKVPFRCIQKDVVELLKMKLSWLLSFSTAFCKEFIGKAVKAFALLEISNICCCECGYCGLRLGNNNLKRYKLSKEEILTAAQNAKNAGFKCLVMQSGENNCFSQDELCDIIRSVKKLGMDVVLSLGEKSHKEYQAYFDAGARGYLLRIEATKEVYKRVNPEKSWERRSQCLRDLKKIGFTVISGIMVGLPEQDLQSIAQSLIELKDADIIGIGPFIPHKETPLAKEKGGSLDLALRTMAVARLLFPNKGIIATTALDAVGKDGCKRALESMANIVMCKVTPDVDVDCFNLFGKGRNAGPSLAILSWLRANGRKISYKL